MTNATDVFPIVWMRALVRKILGDGYCAAWERVMVSEPFDYNGVSIRYGRGNPMGAYSSWALFALAHHFVVYLSCRAARVDFASARYFLLGDDILIGDPRVAEHYFRFLSFLGVEYSKQKTYVSKHMFELAKRIGYRGKEVTGFPVSSLIDNSGSVSRGLSTLRGEAGKGFVFHHGFTRFLEDLDLF